MDLLNTPYKTFYKNIIAFKDIFKLCHFWAHPCTTFAINFKCMKLKELLLSTDFDALIPALKKKDL